MLDDWLTSGRGPLLSVMTVGDADGEEVFCADGETVGGGVCMSGCPNGSCIPEDCSIKISLRPPSGVAALPMISVGVSGDDVKMTVPKINASILYSCLRIDRGNIVLFGIKLKRLELSNYGQC